MTPRACFVVALFAASIAGVTAAFAGPQIAHPREAVTIADRFDSTQVRPAELGWTVGTPAGVNLNGGWWFDRNWGAHVSGMYFGNFRGVQGNVSLTISRSRTTRWALTGLTGGFWNRREGLSYGGAGIDAYLGGLFLEVGIVRYEGTLFDYVRGGGLVAQIGIVGGGGIHGPR